MTIAITGSNGFIGSHLKERLNAEKFDFFTISHATPLSEMATILREKQPSVLIHLASIFIAEHQPEDVDSLIDSNIGFGTRVLEACRLSGVNRIVITGSSWQHLPEKPEVAVNLYGALKTGLESISRFYSDAYGFSVAFLKLYDSFGSNDQRPKLIPQLLKINAASQSSASPLRLSPGEQIVDFTAVENTVDALLKAMEWTAMNPRQFQDFKISGGERMSLRSFVELVQKVLGHSLDIHWGARPYRAREVMQPWDKAPDLPGYSPRVSLREGIEKLFGENK